MDFTKGLSSSLIKDLASSWTELRTGMSAISDPAPLRTWAKVLAIDIYDYYCGTPEEKNKSYIHIFDTEETNEDMVPFKFICDTFGLNRDSLCKEIQIGLPKNIKTLSKMALQNDRKAIEMVKELRRLMVMKENYKPPEKKQIRRQRRKKADATD